MGNPRLTISRIVSPVNAPQSIIERGNLHADKSKGKYCPSEIVSMGVPVSLKLSIS